MRGTSHNPRPGGLASALKEGTSTTNMIQSTRVPHEEHQFVFAGTVNPIVKLGIQKHVINVITIWN